jgi:hypothetical protein
VIGALAATQGYPLTALAEDLRGGGRPCLIGGCGIGAGPEP